MKILLGIDDSRYALAATRFVAEHLAHPGGEVDIVHVLPLTVREGAVAPRRTPDVVRISGTTRAMLDRAQTRLQAQGLRVGRVVRRGEPAQIVPEIAVEEGYELVVVGAKGRSDSPFMPLGSVALAVLEQHAPAHVLLVRERELRRRKQTPTSVRPFRVLFATDGSPRIKSAARVFYRLFSSPHLEPVALAVAQPPERAALTRMSAAARTPLLRSLDEAARHWVKEAKPLLARPDVKVQARVRRGSPAGEIIDEAAQSNASMIVLGSRGVRSPSALPLGSVALQVARHAPCSVLLVR